MSEWKMTNKPNPNIERMKLDAALADMPPEIKSFQDDVMELRAKHPDIMFIMTYGRKNSSDAAVLHTVETDERVITILKQFRYGRDGREGNHNIKTHDGNNGKATKEQE